MIKKGFTLVELLVVVAIFGLLVSLVITSSVSSKEKARDAKREDDMKQIQIALDLYHVNIQRFPSCTSEIIINGTTDCLSIELTAEGSVSGLVVDPIGGSTGTCGGVGSFVYCYQSLNNDSDYRLRYSLEGNSILGKSAGWQEVGS